jgi:hypothetical protein
MTHEPTLNCMFTSSGGSVRGQDLNLRPLGAFDTLLSTADLARTKPIHAWWCGINPL